VLIVTTNPYPLEFGVEADHERGLLTVFGKVEVTRLAYRRRGHADLAERMPTPARIAT
jgi:hypothetical protein